MEGHLQDNAYMDLNVLFRQSDLGMRYKEVMGSVDLAHQLICTSQGFQEDTWMFYFFMKTDAEPISLGAFVCTNLDYMLYQDCDIYHEVHRLSSNVHKSPVEIRAMVAAVLGL